MSTTSLAIHKSIVKKASKKAKQDKLSVSAIARILLSDYADGFISIGARVNKDTAYNNVKVEKVEVVEVNDNTQALMDKIVEVGRKKKGVWILL